MMASIFLFSIAIFCSQASIISMTDTAKLMNGQHAKSGQFPFMVSVQKNKMHICGGVFISELTVITAAQCCNGTKEEFSILAGTIDLNDEQNSSRTSIDDLHIHPRYDAEKLKNDICLMKLAQKLKPSDNMKVIEFETKFDNYQNGTRMGWGLGETDTTLKYASAKIMSHKECNTTYGSLPVGPNNICVLAEKLQGFSFGDYGGPLIVYSKNVPILIGIGSWRLIQEESPELFSKMYYFRNWIKANMWRK